MRIEEDFSLRPDAAAAKPADYCAPAVLAWEVFFECRAALWVEADALDLAPEEA